MRKRPQEHMYLDGFRKFLAIFVKKKITLIKNVGAKNNFLSISQNAVFSQTHIQIDSLRNLLTKNLYFYILYRINVKVTTKNYNCQNPLQNFEGVTILSFGKSISVRNSVCSTHHNIYFFHEALYCFVHRLWYSDISQWPKYRMAVCQRLT